MPMVPRIKTAWVEKLRSETYHQGEGRLMDPLESPPVFCCLGVLCDLYIKEHPDIEWDTTSNKKVPNRIYARSGALPDDVRVWADLFECDPRVFLGKEDEEHLSILNDGNEYTKPKTFKEIADLIEADENF
jgi:hypothetical protein